jgi:hypothetical protein
MAEEFCSVFVWRALFMLSRFTWSHIIEPLSVEFDTSRQSQGIVFFFVQDAIISHFVSSLFWDYSFSRFFFPSDFFVFFFDPISKLSWFCVEKVILFLRPLVSFHCPRYFRNWKPTFGEFVLHLTHLASSHKWNQSYLQENEVGGTWTQVTLNFRNALTGLIIFFILC